jgi:hypothetical protein
MSQPNPENDQSNPENATIQPPEEYIINIYNQNEPINNINFYNNTANAMGMGNLNGLYNISPAPLSDSLQEEFTNRIRELFEKAFTIMYDGIPEAYTQLLETTLLENMSYDDDDVRTMLTYTIRSFISKTTISFERVIAIILDYASRETTGIYSNNFLFANNYDTVYDLCREELRTQLTRSFRMMQFVSLFFGAGGEQEMENVKLVMKKEDIHGMFPEKEYASISEDVKAKNERCVICQDNFVDTDICRELKCEHVFHAGCIDEWLGNQSYKCPCCRTDAGPHYPKEED